LKNGNCRNRGSHGKANYHRSPDRQYSHPADEPNLPVAAAEIAADVRRWREAGASLFHVHARDADEKPTLDISVYQANVRAIKKAAPDVIIQLSTGALAGKDWEARVRPVRLLPEMASFTTG
jgi:3-keto-5-aminohexanoate cleavage enzyme